MAAGENMHSIARRGHIRGVDGSKASGNWGFICINCIRCCSLLSVSLSPCRCFYAVQTRLLTSCVQEKYVGDCWYHHTVKCPVCAEVFPFPLWYLLCELRGWMFLRSMEANTIEATLISEYTWLAGFTSNQQQSYGVIEDDGSPVIMVKSWWQRVN